MSSSPINHEAGTVFEGKTDDEILNTLKQEAEDIAVSIPRTLREYPLTGFRKTSVCSKMKCKALRSKDLKTRYRN